ncbi:MAG TPA: hypothetical protein VGN28_06020 [Blastococcus sp.]|nr:hypothetical protein [Blastococcus sp.]
MQTDPFEARRTGAHRLRVVTASIGAAALLGTGAIAWVLAAPTASASPGTTSQDGSNDGFSGSTTTDDGGQFVVPNQPPQSGGSGSVHASSGGS